MRNIAETDKSEARSAKVLPSTALCFAILNYRGSQLSASLGLGDLFAVANRMSRQRHGEEARAVEVLHWQRDAESAGGVPAAVIIPPCLDPEPPYGAEFAADREWVRAQHAAGSVIGAVCGGVFLLAGTGLLDGRCATTHWSHEIDFAERFERVRIDAEKILIVDEDVVTAGGSMAWIDLGLHFVERFFGPAIMVETAKFLLVDAAGREQRFYSVFGPRLHHGDVEILKVQRWLMDHSAQPVSVKNLADRCGLAERTFLRRFEKSTGLIPSRYVRQLRIGRAREALETSLLSVQHVASLVGYQDASSLSKAFKEIVGLSPTEYRNRFKARLPGTQSLARHPSRY